MSRGNTAESRRKIRDEMENPKAPRITRDDKGWRVDLPGGDYAYQPSEQFAISFARQWTAAEQIMQEALGEERN